MISVIMSVYNEKLEWLTQAVESILEQTYRNFEYIIIVDNPSLDQSLLQYLKRIARADNRVRLHYNMKNQGLMRSLNTGIDLAKGQYIARMDADDISFPSRFEKEIHFLENNGYDMVSTNRVNIDEKGNEISRSKHIKNIPEKHLPFSNIIVHPSVMVKTEVMKKLGGYREFYNSEDYDMWLRILSAGYTIGILDEYLIYYRTRQTSMSQKNKLEAYYITKYQQKLYWERKKNGVDSFTIDGFMTYINSKNISSDRNLKYCKFREYMDKAIEEYKKGDAHFLIDTILAFITFPTIALDNLSSIARMK